MSDSRGDRERRDDAHRGPRGVPSNVELAERTARIEEQVDHVAEVVDEVDEKLDGELADVTDTQDRLKTRQERIWTGYRIARWCVGGGSVSAAVVALL